MESTDGMDRTDGDEQELERVIEGTGLRGRRRAGLWRSWIRRCRAPTV
ncbi:hypothetical protein ABT301_19840 [Streptomyces sp. NPDC000987]